MRPTVTEADLKFTVAVLSLTGILIMVTGAPGEASRALVLARLAVVGVITLLIFQLSPARRDRWVDVIDKDGEGLNQDYWCTECGRDRETGGQPAVCDDCRTERGKGN